MRRVVGKHRERLLSLARAGGVRSADAEDLVQEAFWILARKLADVPERSERAFLTSTTLFLAADRRRTAWHAIMSRDPVRLNEDDRVWLGETFEERQQARRRVDAALPALPDDERAAFVLVELEGLSRYEAAELLDVPSGTLASRLSRARAKFEATVRHLRPNAGETPPSCDSTLIAGNQLFHTNPWGAEKTTHRAEQRLIQRSKAGVLQLGWHWYWGGFERSVLAYPEVLIGWKPWLGGAPTDARLPIPLAKARSLVVTFAVETRASGSYNLALSTWLTRDAGWSSAPGVRSLTTEVMVWPDYTAGNQPPGELVQSLCFDGKSYELWRDARHGKRYEGDREGWTVLTLRGPGGQCRGQIPLGQLLHRLARDGHVALQESVTCVELGNEVQGGAGRTFVEQFEVSL